MKSASEEKAEVFESSFKAFLYTDHKGSEHIKNEMRLKIKRHDLFQHAHYEKKTIPFSLQAKFSYYDLFENNGIDEISKEIILTEIRPKESIIFLGDDLNINKTIISSYKKLVNKIESTIKVPCKQISNDDIEVIYVKNNLLNLKYDSTVLNNIPSLFVKDYGYVYDLKNTFLKIKTRRNEIKEISIVDKLEGQKMLKERNERKNELENIDVFDNLDCFYTKSDVKLVNLKREISKLLNEEFFVYKNYITNANQDFKLFLKNKELVLEGNLNTTYLKIRNCIYSNYINLDEI
jgi:hypothetical protein